MGYPYQPPWESETQIPQYGMSYGGYTPPAAPSVSSPASAAGSLALQTAGPTSAVNPAVSLGLGAAGTLLSAFGGYQASKDADKAYQEQLSEYEFQKALEMQDRQKAEEERKRKDVVEAGDYAGNYLDKAIQRYGQYNATTGR